jgi:hypothetical protein
MRRYSGGTASTSQTPLSETLNSYPSVCIRAASTRRTAGRPRRAPTRAAVARSGDRWTAWRDLRFSPSRRIRATLASTVPWKSAAGGRQRGRPRSTGTECPWFARIRFRGSSSANRCLSFVATTRSMSALVTPGRRSWMPATSSSTSTQPPGSRLRCTTEGSCLSTNDSSFDSRRSLSALRVTAGSATTSAGRRPARAAAPVRTRTAARGQRSRAFPYRRPATRPSKVRDSRRVMAWRR